MWSVERKPSWGNRMLSKSYLATFRKCLVAEGIWGRSVRILTEELEDHYAAKLASLKEEGHDPATAQKLAIEALGQPETVAASAAETLREGCWLARHPWLGAATFFFAFSILVFVCEFVMMLGLAHFLHELKDQSQVAALAIPVGLVMNWGPLIVGLALLGWAGNRYPLGWKSLLIASIALGIAGSCPITDLRPTLHGAHLGYISFSEGGLVAYTLGLINSFSFHAPIGNISLHECFKPINTIRLFFPIVLCLGLHYILRRSNRTDTLAPTSDN